MYDVVFIKRQHAPILIVNGLGDARAYQFDEGQYLIGIKLSRGDGVISFEDGFKPSPNINYIIRTNEDDIFIIEDEKALENFLNKNESMGTYVFLGIKSLRFFESLKELEITQIQDLKQFILQIIGARKINAILNCDKSEQNSNSKVTLQYTGFMDKYKYNKKALFKPIISNAEIDNELEALLLSLTDEENAIVTEIIDTYHRMSKGQMN